MVLQYTSLYCRLGGVVLQDCIAKGMQENCIAIQKLYCDSRGLRQGLYCDTARCRATIRHGGARRRGGTGAQAAWALGGTGAGARGAEACGRATAGGASGCPGVQGRAGCAATRQPCVATRSGGSATTRPGRPRHGHARAPGLVFNLVFDSVFFLSH